jgi:hypothetical protein
MAQGRHILANPEQPRAGDFAFPFYDKTRPILGLQSYIDRLKKELRGLSGERITATFNGGRKNVETGEHRRWTAHRTFVYNRYSDMFGPGSAYLSAIRAVRQRYSDWEIIIYSIDIS